MTGPTPEKQPPLAARAAKRKTTAAPGIEARMATGLARVRNVLVARSFSPEDERRHGIGFLEEVALYARELAASEHPPRAIHLDRLVITLRAPDGTPVGKRARDATIDEVRTARRLLRGGAATARKASPAEKALRAVLGKNPLLAQIAVRASADKASFGGVPLGGLRELARVLATVEVPAGAEATKQRRSGVAGARRGAPRDHTPRFFAS